MSQHHTSGRQGHGPRRPYYKGGRSYGHERRNNGGFRPKNRKQVPTKPSLWQRILGFFGLGKQKKEKVAPKTNTRIARGVKSERNAMPKQPVSGRRLYVGNLSYEATESDLEDVFKGIGDVISVEIIYNPRTHKSKGYAFVEMKKKEDAVRSVDILHNQPFMGRNLLVSGANERQEHPHVSRESFANAEEEAAIDSAKETSTPLFQQEEPNA